MRQQEEVLSFFRVNSHKTLIVIGGGQDFALAYSDWVDGVPPEQVVGSAVGTKFGYGKAGKVIGVALGGLAGD
jgi:hypothetical protein